MWCLIRLMFSLYSSVVKVLVIIVVLMFRLDILVVVSIIILVKLISRVIVWCMLIFLLKNRKVISVVNSIVIVLQIVLIVVGVCCVVQVNSMNGIVELIRLIGVSYSQCCVGNCVCVCQRNGSSMSVFSSSCIFIRVQGLNDGIVICMNRNEQFQIVFSMVSLSGVCQLCLIMLLVSGVLFMVGFLIIGRYVVG